MGELRDSNVAGPYSAVTGYGLSIGRDFGTAESHTCKASFAFTGARANPTLRAPLCQHE